MQRAFLISIFTCFSQLCSYGQEPSIRVGPKLPDGGTGRVVGMSNEYFYCLRVEQERRDDIGFIDGWSKETLTREFSEPLRVPVVNAEEFKVLEFVVGGGRIRMFYSFFSKADARVVLAVATLDDHGVMVGEAMELMAEPGAKENRAGRFMVLHDEEAATTIALYVKEETPGVGGYYEPRIKLAAMDANGVVLFNREVDLGEWKSTELQDLAADKNGNVYLKVKHNGKARDGACSEPLLTFKSGTGEVHTYCAPTLDKNLMWCGYAGFVHRPDGSVCHVRTFGEAWGARYHGIGLSGYDATTAERDFDKLHHFKGWYPADVKHKDKDPHFMTSVRFLDLSFLPDGDLCIYGDESLSKVGPSGEKSFWGLTLNIDEGFGSLWNCAMERKYSFSGAQANPFNTQVIELNGLHYLVANEIRENIGKTCGSLQDWKGVDASGDESVPAFVCMNDNGAFGPRTKLTPSDLGRDQYVSLLYASRGKEYLFRLFTDDGNYFVRLLPGTR